MKNIISYLLPVQVLGKFMEIKQSGLQIPLTIWKLTWISFLNTIIPHNTWIHKKIYNSFISNSSATPTVWETLSVVTHTLLLKTDQII